MPSKASATNGCDGVTAKNRPLGRPPRCHFAATEVSSGRRLRQRGGESTAEKEQAFAEGRVEAAENRGPDHNGCRRERQRALKGLTGPLRKDGQMDRRMEEERKTGRHMCFGHTYWPGEGDGGRWLQRTCLHTCFCYQPFESSPNKGPPAPCHLCQ